MDDLISRQDAIDAAECIVEHHAITPYKTMAAAMDHLKRILNGMPSAQPEQRPLTEDNYAYCAECDPEVKCLSCGHHIAERPFEVYCNIMCKWVNEKDYCIMFEPAHTMEEFEKEVVDAECVTDGQQMFSTEEWKMRKTEA